MKPIGAKLYTTHHGTLNMSDLLKKKNLSPINLHLDTVCCVGHDVTVYDKVVER